jgi:hypothetical protein
MPSYLYKCKKYLSFWKVPACPVSVTAVLFLNRTLRPYSLTYGVAICLGLHIQNSYSNYKQIKPPCNRSKPGATGWRQVVAAIVSALPGLKARKNYRRGRSPQKLPPSATLIVLTAPAIKPLYLYCRRSPVPATHHKSS